MQSFNLPLFRNVKSVTTKRVSIILLIAILSGCQPSLNFAPVRYNKAEIQALLADSSFSYLVLQFKSANGDNSKSSFSLISYAFDTTGNDILATPYSLSIDSGSTAKHFNDSLFMGNQMASRENLLEALTDPGTQATVNYDYLLFTPKLDSSNHYIYYTIEPKQSNPDSSALVVPNSVTQPCPPAKCYVQPEE